MAAKKKHPPASRTVSVEIEGKTYTGSYFVESGVITVNYEGRKTNAYGTQSPDDYALARSLLRALVSGEVGDHY